MSETRADRDWIGYIWQVIGWLLIGLLAASAAVAALEAQTNGERWALGAVAVFLVMTLGGAISSAWRHGFDNRSGLGLPSASWGDVTIDEVRVRAMYPPLDLWTAALGVLLVALSITGVIGWPLTIAWLVVSAVWEIVKLWRRRHARVM